MPKFKVTVTETVEYVSTIEAFDEEAALRWADQAGRDGFAFESLSVIERWADAEELP